MKMIPLTVAKDTDHMVSRAAILANMAGCKLHNVNSVIYELGLKQLESMPDAEINRRCIKYREEDIIL